MPSFFKAVRKAGRRVRRAISTAFVFACVHGIAEEEDVERQMGLGFGLAGPLPCPSSSASRLTRSDGVLDLRRVGEGPGGDFVINTPDEDQFSLCSIGNADDLIERMEDLSSVSYHGRDWDPSLTYLSSTGSFGTCPLGSDQGSFVTAFSNASDAQYELAATRWSAEAEEAATLQFTYLLQTQWFRNAPEERDAIEALYFAAGAAGSFVDVMRVFRR